jgi:hypothetical protein
MKRMLFSTTVLSALILSGGCKEEAPKPAGGPSGTPAATQAHSGSGTDEHTGPKHDLGTQIIGGYTVAAARFADVKPGAETVVELAVTGGSGKPKAVRAWIGTESGEGSTKAKGEGKGDDYDIHLEVPANVAPGAKLWVEIEIDAGKPRGSFDLKR